MKAPDHFRGDDALDDEAAAWLCEREEGFSPERARAFAGWRDCDPRHEAAVARVETTLALLREMPAVRAPLEARFGCADEASDASGAARRAGARPEGEPARASTPTCERRGSRMASRVIRFPIRAWLVAGLAAALVVGALSWRVRPARAGTSERYATDVTAQRRVALRDGSTVDLNVSSDVRILFTKDERRVSLSAGEAHFQVAHDTSRPFVVTAGGVSVRAVGTAFNVRLAGGAVDVLVVEGKVEVTRPMSPASDHADVRPLAAGERTQISRDDSTVAPTVEKIDPAAIRALLAWQERITSFVDVPLRDLVAQFNRRNATQLVIEDAALGGRTIGGVIAVDRVEAFVRLLEQDGDIIAERRRAGEIVLRRAR